MGPFQELGSTLITRGVFKLALGQGRLTLSPALPLIGHALKTLKTMGVPHRNAPSVRSDPPSTPPSPPRPVPQPPPRQHVVLPGFLGEENILPPDSFRIFPPPPPPPRYPHDLDPMIYYPPPPPPRGQR